MTNPRCLVAAGLLALAVPALAVFSYQETLGVPRDALGNEIPIATGSDVVLGGVGMFQATQPVNLSVTVPAGATVKQVFAYWNGFDVEANLVDYDTISLGGKSVQGLRCGGPDFFYAAASHSATYRADITALGLVAPGVSNIAVAGMDFSRNNGIGVVAIIQQGSASSTIILRDGDDTAYHGFNPPNNAVIPQLFTFAAAAQLRTAKLGYLFATAAANRPNVIQIEIEGVATPIRLLDTFGSKQGPEMDALVHDLAIPAGATWVRVTPLSEDGNVPKTNIDPGSMVWMTSTFSLPPVPGGGAGAGCGSGYWKNHKRAWPKPLAPATTIGKAFGLTSGVPAWQTNLSSVRLIDALQGGGGPELAGATKILMRAATAALLNATSTSVNYPISVNDVKLQTLLALNLSPTDPQARKLMLQLAEQFDKMNNLGCTN